jgi:molybdate-binding protein/DNA-binding XRE family transcriptional regulator
MNVMAPKAAIENNLAGLREKRGLSAANLAQMTGVSRQTIYAMEAGDYVPNTVVALRLAHVLETTVEELFHLPDASPAAQLPLRQAVLLPDSLQPGSAGRRVQLCRVDERLIASAASPVEWYFSPADAIVARTPAKGKAEVLAFHDDREFRNRILIAGCDPGMPVLGRHVQAAGVELVLAHRNSSSALALLKAGTIHVAGTHLRDDASGESNLPAIRRMFAKNSVAVVSFAIWQAGILTAKGNPKHIKGVEDFARAGISIVNREKGSGSRTVLDSQLKRLGIDSRRIGGYKSTVAGHLAAAWHVKAGLADCCVATEAAARAFDLFFVPLVSERYDLVIRRSHLESPGVQILLDTLSRSSFRRELESLGGYDTKPTGQRRL